MPGAAGQRAAFGIGDLRGVADQPILAIPGLDREFRVLPIAVHIDIIADFGLAAQSQNAAVAGLRKGDRRARAQVLLKIGDHALGISAFGVGEKGPHVLGLLQRRRRGRKGNVAGFERLAVFQPSPVRSRAQLHSRQPQFTGLIQQIESRARVVRLGEFAAERIFVFAPLLVECHALLRRGLRPWLLVHANRQRQLAFRIGLGPEREGILAARPQIEARAIRLQRPGQFPGLLRLQTPSLASRRARIVYDARIHRRARGRLGRPSLLALREIAVGQDVFAQRLQASVPARANRIRGLIFRFHPLSKLALEFAKKRLGSLAQHSRTASGQGVFIVDFDGDNRRLLGIRRSCV
ncbi:MAG: hypothetical protein BWZ10_02235 [candidate division BRC1 bacterium ADurb.BinA364]|nr:MAG: hypothetical protein BWZ10_02235 [candidate division BRC1 bacterium ADurb.BinA364]